MHAGPRPEPHSFLLGITDVIEALKAVDADDETGQILPFLHPYKVIRPARDNRNIIAVF